MTQEAANKEIVGRWFTEYWQKGNVAIVDELGAEDLVFSYPMHGKLHSREPVKKMLIEFREAFPDLSFKVIGDIIAEGDYVELTQKFSEKYPRLEHCGQHTNAPIWREFIWINFSSNVRFITLSFNNLNTKYKCSIRHYPLNIRIVSLVCVNN